MMHGVNASCRLATDVLLNNLLFFPAPSSLLQRLLLFLFIPYAIFVRMQICDKAGEDGGK
ncbi:hypothetical protein [Mixta intestinalis]|jgi:hypothetical protein|uniref:hypothetical protein n=1 Tax=Mixta intestinalis TaxID=1615494 RepID=UPI00136989DF|nr:hypothetical protein [Mixta intestinalis]